MAELAHLDVVTRIDSWRTGEARLFPAVLGDAFDALPDAVQRVHGARGVLRFSGRAVARGGRGLAALGRAIAGLPGRGRMETEVAIAPGGGEEAWTRRFGRYHFGSRLKGVKGEPGMFEERLGPLALRFSAEPCASGFRWVQANRPFGLRVRARAFEREATYRFSVVVAHRWIGVVVAYAGRLNVNAP
jgi:hypothetical protein